MRSSPLPHGVTVAPPLWSLSAEHNAEHIRAVRHRRAAEEAVADLVTSHPIPWLSDPVTAASRTLERLATSKGMVTRLHVELDGCVLEGRVGDQRLGFRAAWRRGKADSALWYEPEARWTLAPDPRPVGVSKLTRVGLKGRRTYGLGEVHLKQLASPFGVLVSFAELTARVKALG